MQSPATINGKQILLHKLIFWNINKIFTGNKRKYQIKFFPHTYLAEKLEFIRKFVYDAFPDKDKMQYFYAYEHIYNIYLRLLNLYTYKFRKTLQRRSKFKFSIYLSLQILVDLTIKHSICEHLLQQITSKSYCKKLYF